MNMTTTTWKSLAIASIILFLLTLFPPLLDAIETTEQQQQRRPEDEANMIEAINNRWEDNEKTDMMLDIIKNAKHEEFMTILSTTPELAHIRSKDGRGPMFWAYEYNRLGMIQILQKLGVSEDRVDANRIQANPKATTTILQPPPRSWESTTTINNDPFLAMVDRMVNALSKEDVQRHDSLFEQSVRFDFSTKKGNIDGNNDGPVINLESQEACLMAVALAKWYHLHHQTENLRKYLELSLQLFNFYFKYLEEPSELKKTLANIQGMYNNEMKREEKEEGSRQQQQINNNDNSNIDDVSSSVISRNNVNVNVNIDWTDPIFLRVGWIDDPIVIESHKLIFFPVFKNGSTQFLQLFRRMMGLKEFHSDVHSYDIQNPQINGLRYLGHYSRHEQQEMVTSTEWTRAIFVRDPLQRLVSGYKDKAKGVDEYMEGQYVKRYHYIKERCCGMNPHNPDGILSKKYCAPLRPYNSIVTEDMFPFSYFVEHVLPNCPDNHWVHQTKRMHTTNWQLINFVGNFDHLKEDAHTLLKRIGAYEEFGAHGWGKDNGAIFESNLSRHATDTQQTWEHYFVHSPQLLRFAVEYYAMDYEHPVLNFTKPKLLLTMVATDPGTAVDGEL